MPLRLTGWLAPASLLALVWAMPVQAEPAAPRPDPGDARAVVPAVRYQSSLEGYRVLTDEKLLDWKKANELAGRLGGWRFYAKEANEPAKEANEPQTQVGHGKHGGHQ